MACSAATLLLPYAWTGETGESSVYGACRPSKTGHSMRRGKKKNPRGWLWRTLICGHVDEKDISAGWWYFLFQQLDPGHRYIYLGGNFGILLIFSNIRYCGTVHDNIYVWLEFTQVEEQHSCTWIHFSKTCFNWLRHKMTAYKKKKKIKLFMFTSGDSKSTL